MENKRARVRLTGSVLVLFATLVMGATAASAVLAAPPAQTTPVDWVDPYIGTAGSGSEYGGTMPLVTTPFGMTNWTAQTRQNRVSVTSYNYADRAYPGFHRHAPGGDLDGRLRLRHPDAGARRLKLRARGAAAAVHAQATKSATPYYYAVTMDAGAGRTHSHGDDRYRSLRLSALHLPEGIQQPAC